MKRTKELGKKVCKKAARNYATKYAKSSKEPGKKVFKKHQRIPSKIMRKDVKNLGKKVCKKSSKSGKSEEFGRIWMQLLIKCTHWRRSCRGVVIRVVAWTSSHLLLMKLTVWICNRSVNEESEDEADDDEGDVLNLKLK